MGTGGVAVQNLQGEQMHGRHGIEDPIAPDVAKVLTDLPNVIGSQESSEIALDLGDSSEDTTGTAYALNPTSISRSGLDLD